MSTSTIKAYRMVGKAQGAVQDIAMPKLKPGQILVKVQACACNPTDWKHRDFIAQKDAGIGCDFVGTVEDANGSNLKHGERVAGFTHGGKVLNGSDEPVYAAFAEYTVTEPTAVWKVPDTISDEEAAASAGIGPHTAYQSLYTRHFLPKFWKGEKGEAKPLLVWGATSAVGLYAVQLAKLSGFTVVGTASAKHESLLKSLGVDAIYSYSDSETPQKIAEAYPELSLGLDCISTSETLNLALKTLSLTKNGQDRKLVTLLSAGKDVNVPENVKVQPTLVYTMLGKEFDFLGTHFDANAEDRAGLEEWVEVLPGLLESGKLKSNPVWLQEGGLEKVDDHMNLVRDGKNSGQKVVFKI